MCPKVVLGLLFRDFIFSLVFEVLGLKFAAAPLVIQIFILFFPIAGWIADAWVSRYKVIVTCLLLFLVAWVATYTVIASVSLEWPLPLGIVAAVTGMLFICLSYSGYRANMLPFMLDQCIGASSDELSSIVYWYYWFRMLAAIVYKLSEPVFF